MFEAGDNDAANDLKNVKVCVRDEPKMTVNFENVSRVITENIFHRRNSKSHARL